MAAILKLHCITACLALAPPDGALSLSGKVALVTGGSRGIGRGIVEALARQGAAVAFTYREREAPARELEAALAAAGGNAVALACDVAVEEQVQAMAAAAAKALGPVDILVNNAGVTADGFLMIATFTDREFARLAGVVGRPDWTRDERFHTTETRLANRTLLVDLINGILAGHPRTHWIERCAAADVPCGPIQSVGEALDSAHATARGMTVALPRADGRQVRVVGSPIKMSETPPVYRNAPPRVGEHSDEVLRDLLGLDASRIAALRDAGVV